MTDTKKTTNTYHVRDGVAIQAECYAAKIPQVQGTVISGRNHYLVRKGGARVEIKVGDFIIRGENGEVDAMPPALFNQLFTIDAAEAQTVADEAAAAMAIKDKEVAEAAATEAEAQTEPPTDDDGDEVNIFGLPDDVDVPLEPEPESESGPVKKKAKRKRKKKS